MTPRLAATRNVRRNVSSYQGAGTDVSIAFHARLGCCPQHAAQWGLIAITWAINRAHLRQCVVCRIAHLKRNDHAMIKWVLKRQRRLNNNNNKKRTKNKSGTRSLLQTLVQQTLPGSNSPGYYSPPFVPPLPNHPRRTAKQAFKEFDNGIYLSDRLAQPTRYLYTPANRTKRRSGDYCYLK